MPSNTFMAGRQFPNYVAPHAIQQKHRKLKVMYQISVLIAPSFCIDVSSK